MVTHFSESCTNMSYLVMESGRERTEGPESTLEWIQNRLLTLEGTVVEKGEKK